MLVLQAEAQISVVGVIVGRSEWRKTSYVSTELTPNGDKTRKFHMNNNRTYAVSLK